MMVCISWRTGSGLSGGECGERTALEISSSSSVSGAGVCIEADVGDVGGVGELGAVCEGKRWELARQTVSLPGLGSVAVVVAAMGGAGYRQWRARVEEKGKKTTI